MAVKKRPRAPELIRPEEFCRIYADGIHLSLYYRGLAETPPRFPAPVKGIPLADVKKWLRTQGMEFAKQRAARKARGKRAEAQQGNAPSSPERLP